MLQGFDPTDINWRDLALKESGVGHCIGNAQSLNVVMLLLQRALYNALLITKDEFLAMSVITGGSSEGEFSPAR